MVNNYQGPNSTELFVAQTLAGFSNRAFPQPFLSASYSPKETEGSIVGCSGAVWVSMWLDGSALNEKNQTYSGSGI